MYLRICGKCNDRMQERQIAAFKISHKVVEIEVVDESCLVVSRIVEVNNKLQNLRNKIEQFLLEVRFCHFLL